MMSAYSPARAVPFAAVLAVFTMLATLPTTGSLPSSTGDLIHDFMSKRNSWWSKKSGPSVVDPFDDENDAENDKSCGKMQSLFRCYVRECVPDLVDCIRGSRPREEFEDCKLEYRMCGLKCLSATSSSV